MKESEKERLMLEHLWEKKSKVPYDIPYVSSTAIAFPPILGSIEADASGRYGRWNKERFRAYKLAQMAVNNCTFSTVLDVGGGGLLAANFFVQNGKTVDVCDFKSSPYFSKEALSESGVREFIDGDFNELSFIKKYDLVWVAHVLEHQPNIQYFLDKLISLLEDGGWLALAVPPRKPFIVSGHINLFNPGLLVYRCVLAGLDCSKAKIFQYDGNICALIKVHKVKMPKLNFDVGDLQILEKYFPISIGEGFNGDFLHVGIDEEDVRFIYGDNAAFLP